MSGPTSGVAWSPAAGEGFGDIRAVIGAHSEDQQVGRVVGDIVPAFFGRIDVRGKATQTVYVFNQGPEAVLVTLRWYINEIDYIQQYNVASGVTDIRDFARAAHHLAVEVEAVSDTTTVDAGAVATA